MKRRLVAVRPRVGSALERIQNATDNNMSDKVHTWAEMDENGWAEQFKLTKKTEGEK